MEIKDFYKGKRVLVTGHTGFKGSWLCQILVRLGAKVCGIGLCPNTNPNLFSILNLENKIENHFVDIRDYDKIKTIFDSFNPEIVIHLAAQPLVIESYNNPKYTYDVNVMGTVNVCECVRNCASVKSFLNVTTDKVYENIEDSNHYYSEDERLNGYDPYSNSKSCSELVTQTYIRCFYSKDDLSVSTCRAGNVIGGGDFSDNRIIPDCYRASSKCIPIGIRNPNSYRPYQHVLEADCFYLHLCEKQYEDNKYSGHYNIGPNDEDCISTGELVKIFVKYWGNATFKFEKIDGPHEANYLKLNSSKAKNTFGWKPKWNVDKAIEKCVEWYKTFDANGDVIEIINKEIEEFIGE